MERTEFEKLVLEGIKAIPRRFRKKFSNLVIVIEDFPNREQLKQLKLPPDSLIFGLYQGIPQTKRNHYGQVLPDKITIFQKPIEQFARSPEEIRQIVKETVWHEIAHHFGLDEKRIREIKIKK